MGDKIKICYKCNIPLEKRSKRFTYLSREFKADVLTCPKCGQIFLPEEQVNKDIKKVEQLLEGK